MDLGAEIMGGKPQADDQASVAKDLLLISENWVSELRVKAGKCGGFLFAGLDDSNMNGVVGVARPCGFNQFRQ